MADFVTTQPANLLKWVEALESGEYQQGRGALRNDDDTYCCLGVACEVSGLGSWTGGMHTYTFLVDGGGEQSVLPAAVSAWLGLPECEAHDDPYDSCRVTGTEPHQDIELSDGASGIGLNDDRHATFADIAAAIRRDYLPETVKATAE